MYTNLEGGGRAKTKQFFVKICQKFQKSAQKRLFWPVFFKSLPAAQTIWSKQGLFNALGELGKSI